MSQLNDAVIAEHAKTLKLPALRREYGQLARQAGAESWSYEEYLRELLDAEVRAREASTTARRLREARFPDVKTLGQIDWTRRCPSSGRAGSRRRPRPRACPVRVGGPVRIRRR